MASLKRARDVDWLVYDSWCSCLELVHTHIHTHTHTLTHSHRNMYMHAYSGLMYTFTCMHIHTRTHTLIFIDMTSFTVCRRSGP